MHVSLKHTRIIISSILFTSLSSLDEHETKVQFKPSHLFTVLREKEAAELETHIKVINDLHAVLISMQVSHYIMLHFLE